MPRQGGYKVIGSEALSASLQAAAKVLTDFDHSEPNDVMSSAAAGLAPVDSGYLAGSINGLEGEGGIYSDAVYAGIIEFGWPSHHIEPEPYAVPGVKGSADEWMPLYVKQIQDVLNTVKGA